MRSLCCCSVTALEGEQPTMTFTFTEDPTSGTITVEGPDYAETYLLDDPAVDNPSPGVYVLTLPFPPGPGTWRGYAVSVDPIEASAACFTILPAPVTLAEAVS